ncbi:MAG: hypothetical protein MI807_12465 [Verrucomicrobiales bacterium]|nr:hypothetical protein [Verrucomicrobiales bacterium]
MNEIEVAETSREEAKTGPSLAKRSLLNSGGRLGAGIIFGLLAVGAFFASVEPIWLRWVLVIGSLSGLLVIGFARIREEEEPKEEEDVVELARRAIAGEAGRLDRKRANLEKVLMAYSEWMEFPDYQLLQNIDWKDEAYISMDDRVARLLDDEADLMLQRFSSGVYWSEGKFEGRTLLLDLVSFTESIARIYQPDSDRPLLELNLEDILKAINRASIQIILLLEELPVVEFKQMNLRKASDHVRKASTVYKKYEELQPYLKPMRYLWQGSKMLIASNPLLAAGWIAGSELIWKGGKKLGKKAMDAYLLSLVRQTLGIVARETAGMYDSTNRYRNPDWVYGIELAHLLSLFDANQEVLRETFRELDRLPLKSTYDRIFLYRCIAQNASPKPGHFSQPDLLSIEIRTQLHDQLIAFYERNISANADTRNEDTVKWRTELEKRLGLK